MNYVNLSGAFPPELEIYTSLKENQLAHFFEPGPGLFIAESPQVIGMALEAGYEPYSFLLEQEKAPGILKQLTASFPVSFKAAFPAAFPGTFPAPGETPHGEELTLYLASHEQMTKLTGYELTGGALAAFRRRPLPGAEEILKNAKRAVVLESVMNPRNIGSIFRSAAAIGYDAVLLTKGSCDPLYRRAARVSMGTVFRIPWTFIDDVTALNGSGFTTVAMALTDASVSMDDPVLKGHDKLAVLMGSEKTGLQESTIRNADFTARIPMKHGVDSLNVAAASAIAFWELRNTAET